MPKFVIERRIPQAGRLSRRDLIAAAIKSNKVLHELNESGTKIQWQQSYVTDDHLYCVYIADNVALIEEHGKRGGFPVTNIEEVAEVIDPNASTWKA